MTTDSISRPARRPVLISPTAGQPADESALAFRWQPAASTPDARLQVSTSRRFDTLVCDVPVGAADSLVLHGGVPAGEQSYFWRVGREGAWSAPATFVVGTDDAVQAWTQARAAASLEEARRVLRAAGQPSGTGACVEPPCRTGTTSARDALFFAYVLVLTSLTLFLLMYWAV